MKLVELYSSCVVISIATSLSTVMLYNHHTNENHANQSIKNNVNHTQIPFVSDLKHLQPNKKSSPIAQPPQPPQPPQPQPDKQVKVSPDNELEYLTVFEARGEGKMGVTMVYDVIMNRVHNKHFSDTIEGVIRRHKAFSYRHAFTYIERQNIMKKHQHTYNKIKNIANKLLHSKTYRDYTLNSVYYFNFNKVHPSWYSHEYVTVVYKNHVFLNDCRRATQKFIKYLRRLKWVATLQEQIKRLE